MTQQFHSTKSCVGEPARQHGVVRRYAGQSSAAHSHTTFPSQPAVLVMVTLSHENSEMTFRVLCKKAEKAVIHHSKLSNQKW